eukprot:scaffold1700_cov181-Alexandrium_tamarense.AAC.6
MAVAAVGSLSIIDSTSAAPFHTQISPSLVLRHNPSEKSSGWKSTPSFIQTKSSRKLLFQIRGGSDAVKDDTTVATAAEIIEDGASVVNNTDASADDDIEITEVNATQTPLNLTFPATNAYDGSDADPDGIPTRFLLMKKNNREEAKASFEEHLQWRKEFKVDTFLARPHRMFDLCKALVPHYFAGRDPHGNIVLVQRPAMLDFEMMRRNNATIDDLLLHYIWVIEYCWNIIDPSPPEGIMTNVLDMSGISFRQMKNQEYIGFGKRFVNMMSSNYPGRSYKTLVINAPTWFHALYKIFKPMLRESTRQKIVILKAGSQQDTALKFYLGDSLPKDLISDSEKDKKDVEENGVDGTGRYFLPIGDRDQCEPGPNSLMEYDMRQFVSIVSERCYFADAVLMIL